MTSTFQLHHDEWVVMKSGPGAFHGRRPKPGTPKELVLTNKHIILLSNGAFGKQKALRYFPLEQVRVVDGRPQVMTSSALGSNLLEIYFRDGQETFGLTNKGELRAWADNIVKCLTGRTDEIEVSTGEQSYNTSQLADTLKDTLGTLRTSFGLGSGKQPAAVSGSARVARNCSSCGAPISGLAARVVRCQYCDTDQQL